MIYFKTLILLILKYSKRRCEKKNISKITLNRTQIFETAGGGNVAQFFQSQER